MLPTLKSSLAFFLAYTLVMVTAVYTLRLPQHLTGQPALVDEYYVHRPLFSFGLDLVFIVLYWGFAYTVWNVAGIQQTWAQGLILLGTTAFLTAFFWWSFTRQPLNPDRFFSRWFHAVGAYSILYDVILLGLIFVVFHAIRSVLGD
jgi:hypothetical protein